MQFDLHSFLLIAVPQQNKEHLQEVSVQSTLFCSRLTLMASSSGQKTPCQGVIIIYANVLNR